jgi:hypothetical protein
MVTGWRLCRPVESNMGMIPGLFKRLPEGAGTGYQQR